MAEGTNNTAQDEYIASYEDLEIHRLMVSDHPRTEAYRNAILNNKHLFSGKITMDVGAGTGILSLFMAKAGAQKVYAVEASNLAQLIPEVAKANGFGGTIVTIHSKVEDVKLPEEEKVDVIVSEWMGHYLFHESMLSSVLYARDKFLAEDGILFPSKAILYACPCSLESLYKEQIDFWDKVCGFDMSAVKKCVQKAKSLKPDIYQIAATDLLSEPVCIKSLDLRYTDIDEIKSFSSINFVGISKSGNFQGIGLWFDCHFDGRDYDENGEEFGCSVLLSTSPMKEETHWKQTVIVFNSSQKESVNIENGDASFVSPVEKNNIDLSKNENIVTEDEIIGWKLEFNQSIENHRHYNITLEILDPEECEHPIPCTCPMPRCMIITKMIDNEGDELSTEDSAMEQEP